MPVPPNPTPSPDHGPAPRPLAVVVVGAGAVGGVLGGLLASTGPAATAVSFLARGATLAALRERGLRLDTPGRTLHLPPARPTAAPAPDASGAHGIERGAGPGGAAPHGAIRAAQASADGASAVGPADLVLVAVKAEQVPGVAPALAPLVGPATAVVPLQNGVEASGQLAEALGAAHVAEGFCRMLAEQVGPGHVRLAGAAPSVAFGPRRDGLGEEPGRTLARAADVFRAAGVVVETPADPGAGLWEKFLFVEPLGAVGAAARAPFGVLLGTAETRELLARCAEEVLAVARAAGVALDAGALATVWRRYEALPGDGTASMQRDLVAGRTTRSTRCSGRTRPAPELAPPNVAPGATARAGTGSGRGRGAVPPKDTTADGPFYDPRLGASIAAAGSGPSRVLRPPAAGRPVCQNAGNGDGRA